jgi:hypothetical protein
MKVFICTIFTLAMMIGVAMAASVTLEWDPNSPDPDGYAIFQRDHSAGYVYNNPVWQGQETTCTLTVPDDRQTAFVARAFVVDSVTGIDGTVTTNTQWSGDSNEVVFTPAASTPPAPPSNLLLRLLQAIVDWWNGLFG